MGGYFSGKYLFLLSGFVLGRLILGLVCRRGSCVYLLFERYVHSDRYTCGNECGECNYREDDGERALTEDRANAIRSIGIYDSDLGILIELGNTGIPLAIYKGNTVTAVSTNAKSVD